MNMPITQELRNQLFAQLDQLPEPYGWTLTANRDGTTTLILRGKKGHTKGRPGMRSRGDFRQVIRDAQGYIELLRIRGDLDPKPADVVSQQGFEVPL